MKIWVLMFDGWTGPDFEVIESPRIEGIFETEEKAEEARKRKANSWETYEDFSIVEWEVK